MTNVTKPFLPPLDRVIPGLQQIWETRILSNGGPFALELEAKLEALLGEGCHVSLFSNATLALMVAQRVLGVRGEIITPAYSFVATTHAIKWMGNEPRFADIDPNTLCLSPASVAAAISKDTAAIMPLHCYGNLCDVEGIAEIARHYKVPVIYDACHSFGSEDAGGSVFRHGDVAVVSFHATKVFNTFEGGMLVTRSLDMKQRIDRMKNFGFVDEVTVDDIGINGKMSEFNAMLGVTQLEYLDYVISERRDRDLLYRERLQGATGLKFVDHHGQVKPNYSYFPLLVTPEFRITRDELHAELAKNNVNARRYFYPLISEFPAYAGLPSATADNLPVSQAISREVICLPLYPDLPIAQVNKICDILCCD